MSYGRQGLRGMRGPAELLRQQLPCGPQTFDPCTPPRPGAADTTCANSRLLRHAIAVPWRAKPTSRVPEVRLWVPWEQPGRPYVICQRWQVFSFDTSSIWRQTRTSKRGSLCGGGFRALVLGASISILLSRTSDRHRRVPVRHSFREPSLRGLSPGEKVRFTGRS
jgi:hypothetical protein